MIEISETHEYERLSIHKIADHTRAFLKIQDGCNQFCSYCIIPYTRGRVRSRRPDEVVAEVRELAAAGYQEVVLTGIHLSSYGVDFKEEEKKENLLSLIKQVHEVEGIRRIRLWLSGTAHHHRRICAGTGFYAEVLSAFPSVLTERLR